MGAFAPRSEPDQTHERPGRAVASRARRLRAAWAGMICGLGVVLGGCDSGFNTHRASLDALAAQGRYDLAAEMLDDPGVIAEYGEKNRLLYWLERGSVALADDQPERALVELGKADDYMEVLRQSNTGDELGKWLLNDTAAPYYGASYEDMYVSVLKLLAYLETGRVSAFDAQAGATIEARRLANKSDHLRDRFLRESDALQKNPEYQSALGTLPGRNAFAADGQFIESPLGAYLSAITFLKAGEPSLHEVASRRLLTAIDLQQKSGTGAPGVRPEEFESLGALRAADANVLFVALSGRAPTKEAERIGPIPIYTYTLYFELPRLVSHPSRAGAARVNIERFVGEASSASDDRGSPAVTPAGATSTPVDAPSLTLIEDFGAVAAANFERERPAIYTRTYIRSSAKAAAWAVGTEAARKGTSNKESAQAAVEIAGIIGGLLFVTQTEKADLRSWTFLPGQAHVGLARLEPGRYRARIEYLSGSSNGGGGGGEGGTVYAGPWREFTVPPGSSSLTTIVEHWSQ